MPSKSAKNAPVRPPKGGAKSNAKKKGKESAAPKKAVAAKKQQPRENASKKAHGYAVHFFTCSQGDFNQQDIKTRGTYKDLDAALDAADALFSERVGDYNDGRGADSRWSTWVYDAREKWKTAEHKKKLGESGATFDDCWAFGENGLLDSKEDEELRREATEPAIGGTLLAWFGGMDNCSGTIDAAISVEKVEVYGF